MTYDHTNVGHMHLLSNLATQRPPNFVASYRIQLNEIAQLEEESLLLLPVCSMSICCHRLAVHLHLMYCWHTSDVVNVSDHASGQCQ